MRERKKIVDFSKCKNCKYWQEGKEDNYDSPCPECLETFENEDTTDPVYFERKDDEKL